VVARYLALVDGRVPGTVAGLYLGGSLALDDYRPGQSDVDFVAVIQDPLDDAALAELAAIHTDLRPPFNFDGIYVTYDELADDPAAARAPAVHEGRLRASADRHVVLACGGQCCWEAQLLSCDPAANSHAGVPFAAPYPLGLWSGPGASRPTRWFGTCWRTGRSRRGGRRPTG